MAADLETFRQEEGLSYRQLMALIGSNHASRTREWAIGQVWPDADVIQRIVDVTNGAVSLDAMHKRRLQWLRENKPDRSAEEIDAEQEDEEKRCSEGSPR